MLISTYQNNTISIFDPTNKQKKDAIAIETPVQDYFIDTHNNLLIVKNNEIYVYKTEFIKLDTSPIKKIIFVATSNGCLFYYTTGSSFCCFNFDGKEQKEVLIRNFDCDFFVTQKNEVVYWKNREFCIFIAENEHTEQLPFEIQGILPNADKFVILDFSNNIYVFNPLRYKLEGGIKSVTDALVGLASSVFMPLVAVSTGDRVFVLEVSTKQILKTIYLSNVKEMVFVSDRVILLISDKIHEHDFLTGNTNLFLNSNNMKLFTMHSGYCFKRNESADVDVKIKSEILDLKAEMVKEMFDLRKEIEDLKSKVLELEKNQKQ